MKRTASAQSLLGHLLANMQGCFRYGLQTHITKAHCLHFSAEGTAGGKRTGPMSLAHFAGRPWLGFPAAGFQEQEVPTPLPVKRLSCTHEPIVSQCLWSPSHMLCCDGHWASHTSLCKLPTAYKEGHCKSSHEGMVTAVPAQRKQFFVD